MALNTRKLGLTLLVCISLAGLSRALAHGDVTPQAVDTTGLQPVGPEWLEKDPYRGNELAVKIGHSGYAQNCARCHGIEAVSGGIAPDLRYLDKAEEGDAWYMDRIRHGYVQNGATKMPGFEGVLSQEAMWAIRTYLDTRYEGN